MFSKVLTVSTALAFGVACAASANEKFGLQLIAEANIIQEEDLPSGVKGLPIPAKYTKYVPSDENLQSISKGDLNTVTRQMKRMRWGSEARNMAIALIEMRKAGDIQNTRANAHRAEDWNAMEELAIFGLQQIAVAKAALSKVKNNPKAVSGSLKKIEKEESNFKDMVKLARETLDETEPKAASNNNNNESRITQNNNDSRESERCNQRAWQQAVVACVNSGEGCEGKTYAKLVGAPDPIFVMGELLDCQFRE